MLVLSRKRGEQIVIRNDILVTLVEVRRDKVRLGISAPHDVSVHRKEVFDAIARRRNPGCPISYDGCVIISPLSFYGRRARLGLSARPEVHVVRRELVDRERTEQHLPPLMEVLPHPGVLVLSRKLSEQIVIGPV